MKSQFILVFIFALIAPNLSKPDFEYGNPEEDAMDEEAALYENEAQEEEDADLESEFPDEEEDTGNIEKNLGLEDDDGFNKRNKLAGSKHAKKLKNLPALPMAPVARTSHKQPQPLPKHQAMASAKKQRPAKPHY